jgi:hypothetical protein
MAIASDEAPVIGTGFQPSNDVTLQGRIEMSCLCTALSLFHYFALLSSAIPA